MKPGTSFRSGCNRSGCRGRSQSGLFLVLLLLPALVWAQRTPHIGYVYPAGGRQGTSFTVTLGGQLLEGATGADVTGTGVTARLLKHERQVTPSEQDALAKELSQIREKRERGQALTPAEAARAEEIRTTLTRFGRQLANPALNEFATLQVTIASNAPAGRREIRLLTGVGLSNPLAFEVDVLPEFSQPDWKNVPQSRENAEAAREKGARERRVALPIILNGQIQPGGIDRYRFAARRGQKLTITAQARDLLPYLADAVPGWLQAVLTLYDAGGKELKFDDDNGFRPDPILLYQVPADGEYVLEIRDALHRGREDFVYRVTAGEFPYVTDLFPLGGRTGTQVRASVKGWNVQEGDTAIDLRAVAAGVQPYAVRAGGRRSNPVSFAVDTLPEFVERETNVAQAVTLPAIVNGRIDRPGDVDVFQFTGRAGQRVVAEVWARRLGSPLDSFLKLTDPDGRQLAYNDDHVDKASGLDTHHADSSLAFTLPSNGVYVVRLGDTQRQGGPAHAYRLRLGEPQPDFALRVTPSSLNVRAGAAAAVTVYALRRDGFDGEIALSLRGAPDGFSLAGARVPAGQDQVTLTLAAPVADQLVSLSLQGRAAIDGREVRREAIPADDLMQAFAYRHLVPAQDWRIDVWGAERAREPGRLLAAAPVRLPAGGAARIEVSPPPGPSPDMLHYVLAGAPDGISLTDDAPQGSPGALTVQVDGTKVRPGQEGNLVIQVFVDRPAGAPGAAARRAPLGALPALPFVVAP